MQNEVCHIVCMYACMYVLSGGRYQIDAAGGQAKRASPAYSLADVAPLFDLIDPTTGLETCQFICLASSSG